MAASRVSPHPARRSKASADAEAVPARRRFTVDEYYEMAKAGILRADERVELLDGEIYCMSPIGSLHAATVAFVSRWFDRRVGDRAIMWIQNPVRLHSGAEPEPDIVLLRYRPDHYAAGHPGPEDVLLLIEVADTSFAFDRDTKLPEYARAGIPEVWLFNLPRAQAHIYRQPQDGQYSRQETVGRDGRLTPTAFPDLTLPLAELFDTIKS